MLYFESSNYFICFFCLWVISQISVPRTSLWLQNMVQKQDLIIKLSIMQKPDTYQLQRKLAQISYLEIPWLWLSKASKNPTTLTVNKACLTSVLADKANLLASSIWVDDIAKVCCQLGGTSFQVSFLKIKGVLCLNQCINIIAQSISLLLQCTLCCSDTLILLASSCTSLEWSFFKAKSWPCRLSSSSRWSQKKVWHYMRTIKIHHKMVGVKFLQQVVTSIHTDLYNRKETGHSYLNHLHISAWRHQTIDIFSPLTWQPRPFSVDHQFQIPKPFSQELRSSSP